MSVRALNIGVSGLRVESQAIGIIGDNVANVNTPGFKRQREVFQDIFDRGSNRGGSGARLGGIGQAFTQGSLIQTGQATDVALNGDGFFVVGGSVNGMTGMFYSRAGQFHVDPSGALVDPAGLNVMGRTFGSDGQQSAGIAALKVPTGGIPARATHELSLVANLDASAVPLTTPFDVARPDETSTTGTSITVYDSLGSPHALDVYMNKLGDNQWEYRVVANGGELNPPQPDTNVEVASGLLVYNSDGALEARSENQQLSLDFASATPGQVVALDFGTSIGDGGSGLEGTTQFSMPSGVSSQSQDGYSSGALSGIDIAPDGSVLGIYTNGHTVPVGQLLVAKFRATDSLARAGNNLWMETSDSGPPALAPPGAGGRGQVTAGAIESSNVDMGDEMVAMIRHQRAFSANSKVISTADDMLSELMLLKR